MITSKQNPRIKNLVKLQKASERKKQNLVLLEGDREILRAVEAELTLTELYVCPEIEQAGFRDKILANTESTIQLEEVSAEVFRKIAYREGTGGMMALATNPDLSLNRLKLPDNPIILVLEAVEKPGNLGAILRTADAAGVDAVILCDPVTDVFNPNAIRSSIGCIFSVPLATCTTPDAIQWIKDHEITTYATTLEASAHYLDQEYVGSTAIILGTEASGLSSKWTEAADHRILIPMKGMADSLNVSVTAAVLVFEAMRQRLNTGNK